MFRPIDALNVLCAQLTCDLFAIAKFLSVVTMAVSCILSEIVLGLVLNCVVLLCLTYLGMFCFATFSLFCLFFIVAWRINSLVENSDFFIPPHSTPVVKKCDDNVEPFRQNTRT